MKELGWIAVGAAFMVIVGLGILASTGQTGTVGTCTVAVHDSGVNITYAGPSAYGGCQQWTSFVWPNGQGAADPGGPTGDIVCTVDRGAQVVTVRDTSIRSPVGLAQYVCDAIKPNVNP